MSCFFVSLLVLSFPQTNLWTLLFVVIINTVKSERVLQVTLYQKIPAVIQSRLKNITLTAKQGVSLPGVLLLNACLTVVASQANSHKDKVLETGYLRVKYASTIVIMYQSN